jgi:DNA-binding CsgD family transcriptional regulator
MTEVLAVDRPIRRTATADGDDFSQPDRLESLDFVQEAVEDMRRGLAPLWEVTMEAVRSNQREDIVMTTRSGIPVRGSVKAVYEAGVVIGALVLFRGSEDRMAWAKRATFGWESLTESERIVAGLIAEGLTNRDAAARLYVSRHTVDSHLRHIFRKLGINSRVQLAAMASATLERRNRVPAQCGETARRAG